MTLYEINKELLNCIDEETGELLDVEKLEQLQLEKDEKIENLALWIKDLKAESEALKAERENFDKRIKACNSKIESLKNYLQAALDGESFKTTRCSISYRKSEKVEVLDKTAIPKDYVDYDIVPDKIAIKKAIKGGIEITGVELVKTQSIIIK